MTKNQSSIDAWFFHVALGVFVLAMAWLLNINEDGRVAFASWPSVVVPELCFSQKYFGSDCPICGMTRSVISISRGRWHNSFTYHRLGPAIFLLIALQIPYGLQLRFYKRPWVPRPNAVRIGGCVLILSLLAIWAI